MVEYALDVISENLLNLFNKWLEEKKIPEKQRTGRIMFLHKNPDMSDPVESIDKHRPICITSILFKLLEVILK